MVPKMVGSPLVAAQQAQERLNFLELIDIANSHNDAVGQLDKFWIYYK
jgi:hypothetical protein